MYNYTLSLIASFIAMSLIGLSYFSKKKTLYLTMQASGMVFLVLSYFFTVEFLPMISQVIGFSRACTFFWYEKNNKDAPVGFAYLFSGLSILNFVILNIIIFQNATVWDVLYVVALCFYTFSFRIRNLTLMRYILLIPNGLSIAYNWIIGAPIFATLSYGIELTSNIVSILKYEVFAKRVRKS